MHVSWKFGSVTDGLRISKVWFLFAVPIGFALMTFCLAQSLHPLALEIGVNEIQFCIMMVTSLGVGFITSPLGLNLFIVSGLTGESILRIAARAGLCPSCFSCCLSCS